MPGPSLHLHLIDSTMGLWRRSGSAPVELSAPGVMAAMRFGAVAPDMGYYPGAEALLADLAHYVRSGDLARAVLDEAETEKERAFAWGWVSHMEVDALLHPIINREVASMRGLVGAVLFDDDPATHVRIEFGLDTLFHSRFGTPPLDDADSWTALLARAYQRTYDAPVAERAVRRTLMAGMRLHRPFTVLARLAFGALHGTGVSGRLARWTLTTAGLLARLAPSPVIRAAFRPVAPSKRLIDGVATATDEYHDRMEQRVATSLADLPNYNLDTGEVGPAASTHPLASRTQERLDTRWGT